MSETATILVAAGEAQSRGAIVAALQAVGHHTLTVQDGLAALKAIREEAFDLLLLDLSLPDVKTEKLLQSARRRNPLLDVVLITPDQGSAWVIKTVRMGGEDYVGKPVDAEQLVAKVGHLIRRRHFLSAYKFVGKNPRIHEMIEIVAQVAPTQVLVLIIGESGTGKDLVARAVHEHSPRRQGPFKILNCAALAEGVIESELFGHEKGGFTGATSQRKGFFEQAHQGTLFLDEIGEMPLAIQVKLLRVLEGSSFTRVGGSTEVNVDVRVIAATNRDLEEAVRNGTFRRDLYYRLKVVTINLPSLRERRDDIPLLVHHFIAQACVKNNLPAPALSDEAIDLLTRYNWPGNVRQLKNFIESLVVMYPGQELHANLLQPLLDRNGGLQRDLPVVVTPERSQEEVERELIYKALLTLRQDIAELKEMLKGTLLGQTLLQPNRQIEPLVNPLQPIRPEAEVDETQMAEDLSRYNLARLEQEAIKKVLALVDGNRKQAADILGIGERTLYRKLKDYDLS